MALTSGTNIQLDVNNPVELIVTAFTAADGITFPMDGDCQRMLLVLDNTAGSAASTFTIHGGTSEIMGLPDKTVSVASGKTYVGTMESGGYRQLSGNMSGSIFITASGGTPKAALVALPQYHLT